MQTNELVVRAVEFVCKQLYILHRKPFLLQMFGSIAPILDRDGGGGFYGYSGGGPDGADAFKVQPKNFYRLLSSLGRTGPDLLHVMELVKLKKPIQALDFCYQGDPENISVLECISLCVLVVAYDSGTRRAREMLAVLKAIFPYFLRDMLRDKKADAKTVRETIHQLTLTMRALLSNCDELTK